MKIILKSRYRSKSGLHHKKGKPLNIISIIILCNSILVNNVSALLIECIYLADQCSLGSVEVKFYGLP